MWADRRVLIMGLGAFGGGLGVTRWLCQQGADVTVTDLRPEQDLTDAIASLESLEAKGKEDKDNKLHDAVDAKAKISIEMEREVK